MKKMNYIKGFVKFLLLFSIFIFAGCNNLFSGNAGKSKTEEKALVSFSINSIGAHKAARTANANYSDEDITSITLKGKLTSEAVTERTLKTWNSVDEMSSTDLALEPGSWTFTLSVVLYDENNGVTFTGTQTANLGSGENEAISFELSSLVTYGGMNIKISYSGGTANSVDATLTNISNNATIDTTGACSLLSSGSENYALFTKALTDDTTSQLPSGTYRLKIKFYGDFDKSYILNTYSVIVNVAPGFVTSYEQEISINQLYTINVVLDDGELPAGAVIPECYSVFSEIITLPIPEKANYIFGGWYKDAYFETEITEITADTAEDLTLYAKWDVETQQVDVSISLKGDLSNIFVDISGAGSSLTFAAKDAASGDVLGLDYTFTWLVDGVAQSDMANPITIDASTWPSGIYDITLRATKSDGGEPVNYVWSGQHVIASYGVVASTACSNITELISAIGAATGDFSIVIYATIPADDIASIATAIKAKDRSQNVSLDMSNITVSEELPYSAFMDCNALYSVKLPEGITAISTQTFRLCEKLAELSIPSTVSTIAGSAFYRCGALTNVTLAGGNADFTLENDILYTVDKSKLVLCCNKNLSSVTIPSTVEEICDYAFSGANMTEVIFESDLYLQTIGQDAFDCCQELLAMNMPNSVTTLKFDAFYCCSKMTSLHISTGLTALESSVFSSCASLTTVTIPEGITEIKSSAFYNCGNIESIVLPSSLTTIGSSVFNYCENLKTVNYRGTETQKDSITIADTVITGSDVTWNCGYTGD